MRNAATTASCGRLPPQKSILPQDPCCRWRVASYPGQRFRDLFLGCLGTGYGGPAAMGSPAALRCRFEKLII